MNARDGITPRDACARHYRARHALSVGIALLALAGLAGAQSNAEYEIVRGTISAGGGAQSGAGGTALVGALGQPAASSSASGGGYVVQGGVLPVPVAPSDAVFRDGFE